MKGWHERYKGVRYGDVEWGVICEGVRSGDVECGERCAGVRCWRGWSVECRMLNVEESVGGYGVGSTKHE